MGWGWMGSSGMGVTLGDVDACGWLFVAPELVKNGD